MDVTSRPDVPGTRAEGSTREYSPKGVAQFPAGDRTRGPAPRDVAVRTNQHGAVVGQTVCPGERPAIAQTGVPDRVGIDRYADVPGDLGRGGRPRVAGSG